RRKSQDCKVATCIDHSRAYSTLTQALQGGVNRHTFRNSSKVEFGTDGERYLSADWIYPNAPPSPSRLPRYNGSETNSWKVVEGTVISQLHQLIKQGGIIHSLRNLGCGQCSCQNSIEQVADGNRFSGLLIEPRQLT